jgi:hypothetical protein
MVFYFLEHLERLEPWNDWNRFRLRISAAIEPFERAAVAVTRVRDTCSCQGVRENRDRDIGRGQP